MILVEMLLNAHAKVDLQNGEDSSMDVACERGHDAVVEMLLNDHANLYLRDMRHSTPLRSAVRHRHHNLAQAIENLIARKGMLSLLGAQYLRTGVHSPKNDLPPQIYRDIFELLRKTDR